MLAALAMMAQQVVHVVPSGWDLVAAAVVEIVYYGAGLVTFEEVVFVLDISVEYFPSKVCVFLDHEVVGVTGADKEVGEHERGALMR